MSPSRILIGQFLVVLTIIVLTMWGTTMTAHALAYQRGLGRPWFQLGGWPVYRPWRLSPRRLARTGCTGAIKRSAGPS